MSSSSIKRIKSAALPASLLLLGFAIGRFTQSEPPVIAATQQTTQPKTFKSGGARSIVVLKEISATLKTTDKRVADMDKRVANIEKLLQKMAEAKPKQ